MTAHTPSVEEHLSRLEGSFKQIDRDRLLYALLGAIAPSILATVLTRLL